MPGWWDVVDQLGVQRPSQYRNVGRPRTGFGSMGLGAGASRGGGTRQQSPVDGGNRNRTLGEPYNGSNVTASAGLPTYSQYASMTQNAGGAPMSYYDYAAAANTGADVADIPVQVNGMPMIIPQGTAGWNLGAPVETQSRLGQPTTAPAPATSGVGVQINQSGNLGQQAQQTFVRDGIRRQRRR